MFTKYYIELSYKAGKDITLADTLSRGHINETGEEIPEEEITAQIQMIYKNSCLADEGLSEVQRLTFQDDEHSQIATFVPQKCPANKRAVSDQIKSYWSYKEGISVINGIWYKEDRSIIPSLLRQDIPKKLHQAHMDIGKTKLRARDTVFWARHKPLH